MKLFNRCEHDWKEIARTYQQSQLEALVAARAKSYYQLPDIENSYTTILWECTKCRKFRREVLNGKEIKNEI